MQKIALALTRGDGPTHYVALTPGYLLWRRSATRQSRLEWGGPAAAFGVADSVRGRRHYSSRSVSNRQDMLSGELDPKSIWMVLSASNKLFFVFVCGVAIRTIYACAFVLSSLHSLREQAAKGVKGAESRLAVLRGRLLNLQQLQLFTLYLCALCVTLNIPNAFVILGDSKSSPIGQYLQNLGFLFYFYTPLVFGLLLLHSLQWAATHTVDSFARRSQD